MVTVGQLRLLSACEEKALGGIAETQELTQDHYPTRQGYSWVEQYQGCFRCGPEGRGGG